MATAFISGNGADFKAIYHEKLGTTDHLLQVFVEVTNSRSDHATSVSRGETIYATSAADAVFQVKQKMDEAGILEGNIFVPPGKLKKCAALKSVLFMDAFHVEVSPYPAERVLVELEEKETSSNDFESEVTKYLTTVSSIGEISTIRSNLIPSQLFGLGYTLRWGGISASLP